MGNVISHEDPDTNMENTNDMNDYSNNIINTIDNYDSDGSDSDGYNYVCDLDPANDSDGSEDSVNSDTMCFAYATDKRINRRILKILMLKEFMQKYHKEQLFEKNVTDIIVRHLFKKYTKCNGSVFTDICNFGRQDAFLMSPSLLQARLAQINN